MIAENYGKAQQAARNSRIESRGQDTGNDTVLRQSHVQSRAEKSLFKNRWHVELDLRNLKTTMGLEMLSCKTPSMAIKELWVYLLAHNLIRLIMAQSASLADCLPRELNFKHSLQLRLAWRQFALMT